MRSYSRRIASDTIEHSDARLKPWHLPVAVRWPKPIAGYLIARGIKKGNKSFIGPEHVVIDITNRCINSCIACWTRSPLLKKHIPPPEWCQQDLPLEQAFQLIEELHRLGTRIIRFTGGGEPLLYRGIWKLIRRVKACGMYCALTTSMWPFRASDMDGLIYSGLDELSVSLWASSPEEYKSTHPGQSMATFAQISKALSTIKNYKSSKKYGFMPRLHRITPKVTLLNVICSLNCEHLEKMFDYALNVGADSIYFAVVDTLSGSTDNLLMSRQQRAAAIESCRIIRKRNSQLPKKQRLHLDGIELFEQRLLQETADTGEYDHFVVDEVPCYVGWIFCRILATGDVAPCCRGVHKTMGNIKDRPFEEIWFSERYDEFRECAKNITKHHCYFSGFNCNKTCDNHAHNLDVHQWIRPR